MKKSEYPKHVEMYVESAKQITKQPFIRKAFLAPDIVLKMLIGNDKICKKLLEKSGGRFQIITSDFALYEAISCITQKELDLNLLKDFLYKVEIVSSPKIKIDMDRIDHLRGSLDGK